MFMLTHHEVTHSIGGVDMHEYYIRTRCVGLGASHFAGPGLPCLLPEQYHCGTLSLGRFGGNMSFETTASVHVCNADDFAARDVVEPIYYANNEI